MFWRKQLDALVARLRARNLPLRLVLWNGASFDLGDDPRVTLTLPAMSGLRYLLTPSLDNLGTAYVEGDIQVAGSARDIIAVAAAMHLVLISGLSGSGKSIAINVLEDAGYYCVDNLPSALLIDLVEELRRKGYRRVGVAMLRLARAGALILPPNPGFYAHPQSVDDLVDFVVARILDQLHVPQSLQAPWGGEKEA